jgi:hypothetical protein
MAVVVSLVTGVAAQGIKIVVDAGAQGETDDAFRGRVFALYDVLFNVCLVTGLLIGALGFPASGRSWAMFAALSVGYLALTGWVAWWTPKQGWATLPAPDDTRTASRT